MMLMLISMTMVIIIMMIAWMLMVRVHRGWQAQKQQ